MSVFEDTVSTETGSSGINTQSIKHLQSNYCAMTSSGGSSSVGVEITQHPGGWRRDNSDTVDVDVSNGNQFLSESYCDPLHSWVG